MAAGAFKMYHNGLKHLLKGEIDFDTDTIKAGLFLNTYTPSQAVDDNLDEIDGFECADAGYARKTVTTKTVTNTGGAVVLDADDVDFGNPVTITAKYLVLWKDTGTPSTSYLIGYVDLDTSGGSASSNTNQFRLNWNANGIMRFTL